MWLASLGYHTVVVFQLKDEAVSLVDVVAPPDFILKSPIGASDGQVDCTLGPGGLQGEGQWDLKK